MDCLSCESGSSKSECSISEHTRGATAVRDEGDMSDLCAPLDASVVSPLRSMMVPMKKRTTLYTSENENDDIDNENYLEDKSEDDDSPLKNVEESKDGSAGGAKNFGDCRVCRFTATGLHCSVLF